MSELTQDKLKSLLHYDPDAGSWWWRISRGGMKAGSPAGRLDPNGYLSIHISGKHYMASRLAFLYMTGSWPNGECDHIDRDGSNNKWSNLRSATRSQNLANRKLFSTNSSGIKGVRWMRPKNKWRAEIRVDGKLRHLGYFDSRELAASAYQCAAKTAFGEYHAQAAS